MSQKSNFEIGLEKFLAFMITQNKITTIEDLIPGVHYSYRVILLDGIKISEVSLWHKPSDELIGDNPYFTIPDDCDWQIDVKIPVSGYTQVQVFFHKTGTPLFDRSSWVEK